MSKWYEDPSSDTSPIISSRVRLARNLRKYPFAAKITATQSVNLVNEVAASIKNDYMSIGRQFNFFDLKNVSSLDLQSMIEKHNISPELLRCQKPKGVLLKDDETVSIMVNEEDHIRIQALRPGKNIEGAWDLADKIDNLMEESLDYAYDAKFGYLTSCPSNTGTGMRASFMAHMPMLEKTGNIQNLVSALSKLGMTIRGIYGEGSESYGSIYQISNQVTMGKTEEEIINGLKSICDQIEESEINIFNGLYKKDPSLMEDNIYRSYGILKNARQMTMKEAMNLLSAVRLGYVTGVLKEKRPSLPIYNIMMNIEPGNIQLSRGSLEPSERDIMRAGYLREVFNKED